MPTIEDFFLPLRADLAKVREAKRLADLTEASDFNVLRYLKPDENLLSDVISDLLDPRGPHGQGPLFLERFLRTSGIDLGQPLEGARVRREAMTTFLAQNRRIDFTVEVGPFGVGVENKPWAGDQAEQVADYVKHLEKKYGEGQYFLVYLSGSGSDPTSLGEVERERLKRQGRFRTLPYVSGEGVLGWLQGCREGCRAEKVRVFLGDLVDYIDTQFGGTGVGKKGEETGVVVKHALRDEESLALFLDVANAFEEVSAIVISDFTRAVTGRLRQELGEGWLVMDESQSEELSEAWEKIAVRKEGWPGGPGWKDSLRVVVQHDHPMPCEVFFQVKRDKPEQPPDPVSDRIAEALSARCGRGGRGTRWWPYWYMRESHLTKWANRDVLLELWRKGYALDHFVNRLSAAAKAVDEALQAVERAQGP
jgi:hypothetical protein